MRFGRIFQIISSVRDNKPPLLFASTDFYYTHAASPDKTYERPLQSVPFTQHNLPTCIYRYIQVHEQSHIYTYLLRVTEFCVVCEYVTNNIQYTIYYCLEPVIFLIDSRSKNKRFVFLVYGSFYNISATCLHIFN